MIRGRHSAHSLAQTRVWVDKKNVHPHVHAPACACTCVCVRTSAAVLSVMHVSFDCIMSGVVEPLWIFRHQSVHPQ